MVSKKQIIMVIVLLLAVGLIIGLGMYGRKNKAPQTAEINTLSLPKADEYSINGKVLSVSDTQIVLEVPRARVNSAGVAESTMTQKMITVDKFIDVSKTASGKTVAATLKDLKTGQNVVIYTWIDPIEHDTFQVSRINIQ